LTALRCNSRFHTNDADIRRIDELAAALERYGYRVLVAEDGVPGIDMFRELADPVRVVLLDMTMPGIDGAEVLRRLCCKPV